MKQIEKRVQHLEEIQSTDPEVDFSKFSDEELIEVEELIKKTGENEDYSLLSDGELKRLIELINRAENEAT
ncbi:hypothetical protein DYD21_10090 [Rhodohalobacter sp. SW132]|uniref:hypothetical protein n=1 Tax=Rhodohalobacter sp. SW132 TaxID=2293433 RepID=UPI000E25F7A6|nr:hypothetical protein [Rhodohalobacter sp. SW132]REL33746.1 hypothetical protein DYD21_10090 [Rhodohalobacter sp. SW132]